MYSGVTEATNSYNEVGVKGELVDHRKVIGEQRTCSRSTLCLPSLAHGIQQFFRLGMWLRFVLATLGGAKLLFVQ